MPQHIAIVLFLAASTALAGPPSRPAQEAFLKGQDFAAKNDNANAIAQFKEAVRLSPTFRDAHFHLAMQLDIAKDHDGANAAYDTATQLFPKDAELWAEWGTTLILLKRFNKAVSVLEKAVELGPRELAWQGDLAYATAAAGHADKALELYEKAFAAGLQDPVVRRQYGDTLARTGALVEAEKVYTELLQQKPGDRDLLYRRAKVRAARGDKAGAAADEAALKAAKK